MLHLLTPSSPTRSSAYHSPVRTSLRGGAWRASPRRTTLPASRAVPRGGPCARESTPKHRTRSRIAAMSGPFPLYVNAALRQAEARAASRLGDDFVLMQRAGLAAWHCALAHLPQAHRVAVRSEERRVGHAGVSTCRSRWSRSH